MQEWKTSYKNAEIRVTNSLLSEKLYINGELQDYALGFGMRSLLWGEIAEDDKRLEVKVRLGSHWRVTCNIFVDNKPIILKGKEVLGQCLTKE